MNPPPTSDYRVQVTKAVSCELVGAVSAAQRSDITILLQRARSVNCSGFF